MKWKWNKRPFGIFIWVLVGLILAGCTTVKKTELTELLWPPPPLTSRIKFVGLLHNEDDLGKSGSELFIEALIGRKTDRLPLQTPMALTPSRDGKRLYVSDYARHAVLVFDFDARRVSLLESAAHPFNRPFGLAVDGKDNVYVADSDQRLIRVFDLKGKFLHDITEQSLERPTGLAIDPNRGRLYVADSSSRTSENHFIYVFDLDGNYLKRFGGRGFEEGKLYFPTYVAVDATGNLYVTDTMNGRVQIFDAEGRYLETLGERGDKFGNFDRPKGVALDTFGNVYVVDSTWSNVQIFNPKGQILLYFAGRGRIPGLLFNPAGIAIDKDNRIYVADAFNGRVAIYQLINTRAEDSFLAMPPQTGKGGDATKKSEELTEAKATK